MRSDGQTSPRQQSAIARVLATSREYFGLKPIETSIAGVPPAVAPSILRIDTLERFGNLPRCRRPDAPGDLLARVEEH